MQIPVTIPRKVSEQIDYLCRVISTVEWSGVLFYTTKGKIENNTLKITVTDILPMDKGTTGFTSFAMDNRVIDYLIDNNAVEKNLKMGLIHSHHNMATFFSGEDLDELKDGARTNNIYLSLIVNNRGDRSCKIAYEIAFEKKFKAKNQDGKDYSIQVSNEVASKIETNIVFSHDCVLTEEQIEIKDKTFMNKVQEICNKPSFESTKVRTTTYNGSNSQAWKSGFADWEVDDVYGISRPKIPSGSGFKPNDSFKTHVNLQPSLSTTTEFTIEELEDVIIEFYTDHIETLDEKEYEAFAIPQHYFTMENLTQAKQLLLKTVNDFYKSSDSAEKRIFAFDFLDFLQAKETSFKTEGKSFLSLCVALEKYFAPFSSIGTGTACLKDTITYFKTLIKNGQQ